ncbi:MAG: UDP-3-O-(3-hydroxymyristoyl)glucosamine N-acyltransferase [Verrucomicrobiae bacterium]|nr:UDP-3-O-(3-hydroxymyristoyl)glucosamine N-acyltransferase [Verrucomicrobiae bacterium]
MQKTTAELAELLGGILEGDPKVVITGASTLEEAQPGQVSFLGNLKYLPLLKTTRASAVLVQPSIDRQPAAAGRNYIVVPNPSLAFARLVELTAPPAPKPAAGVHPSCVVEAGAQVDPTACIGPLCVIAKGAKIGARTVFWAQCYVGPETTIGEDCIFYPQVVLRERVTIGNRVILHPGVVIGADGFGFEPTPDGLVKVPQVGGVIIEDDVELGANTSVDRGRLGPTRVKRGVKIDNLVQVAHNVVIGESSAIAALTGVAGSTKIGKGVLIGGQAGFAGHTSVGDGAQIAAQSGIHADIEPGEKVYGTPAQPAAKAMKAFANVQRIPYLLKRLKELEKEVASLQGNGKREAGSEK